MSDDDLLEKARNSRKGTKFAALWDGDLKHSALEHYKEDHSAADLALCNGLAFWTGRDPDRMDRLFRRSGLMRDKWDTRHSSDGRTYGQMTIERAIERCQHCFGEREPGTFGEVVFPKLTAEKIPPASGSAGKDTIYTEGQLLKLLYPQWKVGAFTSEAAHAARLAQAFDGDLRYCPQLGWLLFNGRFWERDDKQSNRTVATVAMLSEIVRAEITQLYELGAMLARAGRQGDAAAMTLAAKVHARHIKTVETNHFIYNTLSIAAGNLCIAIEKFNARPFRLAFQNLVWDKGVRRPHEREDYLVALSPIEIAADAHEGKKVDPEITAHAFADETLTIPDAPEEALDDSRLQRDWPLVLGRITQGDGELERTLQDVVGYMLSGSSDMRLILCFYGEGGTGKSTVSELVQTVLGGSTYPVSPGKLSPSADRERLGAALWNCRLTVCSESGNQKIDSEVLKLISGADTMAARFHYQEVFTMQPTHAVLMISNDAPYLDAYDNALKDRVLVLPFDHPLGQGGNVETGASGNRPHRERSQSPEILPGARLYRMGAGWIGAQSPHEIGSPVRGHPARHQGVLVRHRSAQRVLEDDSPLPFRQWHQQKRSRRLLQELVRDRRPQNLLWQSVEEGLRISRTQRRAPWQCRNLVLGFARFTGSRTVGAVARTGR